MQGLADEDEFEAKEADDSASVAAPLPLPCGLVLGEAFESNRIMPFVPVEILCCGNVSICSRACVLRSVSGCKSVFECIAITLASPRGPAAAIIRIDGLPGECSIAVLCVHALLSWHCLEHVTATAGQEHMKNGQCAYSNAYLSPVLAPASLLARFPPTHVIACEFDAFLDDSADVHARLSELGALAPCVLHYSLLAHAVLTRCSPSCVCCRRSFLSHGPAQLAARLANIGHMPACS